MDFSCPARACAAAKKDAPTAAELSAIIESKIMDYGGKVELQEIGKVLAIGDGIARCVVVGASNASRIMRRARRRGALPGPSAAGSEPWAWGRRRGLGGMLVAPLLVAPACAAGLARLDAAHTLVCTRVCTQLLLREPRH